MMRLTSVVLLVVFVCASPASAYFVIILHNGGTLRADFVRQQADVIHASVEAGELSIEKTRIRSIREVDPGPRLDVAKLVAAGIPKPLPATATPSAPSAASSIDPKERERQVVREIILGHRDLLLAKLRKESPEELAKRQQELGKLKNERAELLAKRPSWERGSIP